MENYNNEIIKTPPYRNQRESLIIPSNQIYLSAYQLQTDVLCQLTRLSRYVSMEGNWNYALNSIRFAVQQVLQKSQFLQHLLVGEVESSVFQHLLTELDFVSLIQQIFDNI